MSGLMLVAALWCGAGEAPSGSASPPTLPVSVESIPGSSTAPPPAPKTAPAEPPAKKGLYFGCVRDRFLGRPAAPKAPEPAAQQASAPATPAIVQTKAEERQPPKTDKPKDAGKPAKAKKSETFTNIFGVERTRVGWTGN